MHAIKQIRKYLENNSTSDSAPILARFAAALTEEKAFSLADMYRMNYEEFELAIDLLKDWRFDRHYAGSDKLFEVDWSTAAPTPLAA